MPAYAIAQLDDVQLGPEIADYLLRIDATLEPFGGRFLIHGADPEVLEPGWTGRIVVIAFPDLSAARGWYESAAYQAILPLRVRNSNSTAFLIEGVKDGYHAMERGRRLLAESGGGGIVGRQEGLDRQLRQADVTRGAENHGRADEA